MLNVFELASDGMDYIEQIRRVTRSAASPSTKADVASELASKLSDVLIEMGFDPEWEHIHSDIVATDSATRAEAVEKFLPSLPIIEKELRGLLQDGSH